MKPDLLVHPIVDTIFVPVPEGLEPEVKDPEVGGHVIEGNVIIAARMRPLYDELQRVVDYAMTLIPQPPQVKKRVVTGAEWSVLSSVGAVEAYRLPHDCSQCRDGRRSMAAFLRAHPGRAVAMCHLTFNEHIEAVKVGTAGDFIGRGGVFTGDAMPETVVTGEACSMCAHPLDPHELWLFGDPSEVGAPPGRMTCPVDGCDCQSHISFAQVDRG